MAAVSLSPLPQPPHFPMASKRTPLANNPNAANSPYRVPVTAGAAGILATKRSRTQTNDSRENESPPKKKQIVEHIRAGSRRPQPSLIDDQEGQVFISIPENTNTTAFQRRLAAHTKQSQHQSQQQPQQHQPQKPAEKAEKQTSGDLESIKQWRKHYRRVFPSFVFYFESLPIDVCIRSSRQIAELGAREEKFFSRSVTHIVTSRQIPPTPTESESAESQALRALNSQTRTINPSLLDKSAEPIQQQNNGRSILEAAAERRSQASLHDAESRKNQSASTDVLHKAREMNIKIWALEKFERMMRTMFEDLDGPTDTKKKVSNSQTRPNQDVELSQMLRNEKKQQARVPWTDIIPFRGLYIYIHDVDEKTKPIAIREYAKVSRKEDGDWPQFRSNTLPRCPFLDDTSNEEKTARPKKKEEKQVEAELHQQPRTRAVSAAIEASKVAAQEHPSANALRENKNAANRCEGANAGIPPSKATFEPPKLKPTASCSGFDSMLPPFATRLNLAGARPGREPAASGLQQSNVTSAIKSQVISSTAAAPGIRAGTTKEIHQLQRRAVERRGAMSTNSGPTSHSNDTRTAPTNENANTLRRTTRNKPIETLAKIHEDEADSDKDENMQTEKRATQLTRAPRKKAPVRKEREIKPGYCENCRDKYDDFSEHIESRKHKKFALSAENWADLDNLLKKLARR